MNSKFVMEAAGALGGLPQHWIKYLAYRYGKGSGYGYDMGGENSTIIPLKKFDPGTIKKALKDKDTLAVIGRKDGEPIFMIASHDRYTSKFRIFEVEKSQGNYDSKGTSFYTGRRRGNYKVSDAHTMNEIIDIIDQMMKDKEFENLTVEAITKDTERAEKIKQRSELRNKIDPLYSAPTQYGRQDATIAQRERAKKYGALKKPKLDARIDSEVKKMKDQLSDVLDQALEELIDSVKKGSTYNVSKSTIAQKIANKLDITGIQRLAQAYSAIKSDYTRSHPDDMAKELKSTGLA